MLIWGTNHTALKEEFLLDKVCSNCNNDELVLHGIQGYRHIWYLPLFPSDKIFYLTCTRCGTSLENDAPEALAPGITEAEFKHL